MDSFISCCIIQLRTGKVLKLNHQRLTPGGLLIHQGNIVSTTSKRVFSPSSSLNSGTSFSTTTT